MEIKWYGLAKLLGLVEDISSQYNDGYIHHSVSSKTGDVFTALTLSLIPLLFLAGFLLGRRKDRGQRPLRIAIILLLVYAVLLAVGVGPYIQFYPQSVGFIDLSALEHIVDGIYTALLALCLYLGGRLGHRTNKQP